MNRSSAYVVLGERFARAAEGDRVLWTLALVRAEEKQDGYRAEALRALEVRP